MDDLAYMYIKRVFPLVADSLSLLILAKLYFQLEKPRGVRESLKCERENGRLPVDAISGSARFESKLSCLINVARANNWRGCGGGGGGGRGEGGSRNSNHHESISALLYGNPSPSPPYPHGTPLYRFPPVPSRT